MGRGSLAVAPQPSFAVAAGVVTAILIAVVCVAPAEVAAPTVAAAIASDSKADEGSALAEILAVVHAVDVALDGLEVDGVREDPEEIAAV